MVKLKAKSGLKRYRGKALVPGQPINASRRDARLLLATNLAEPDLGTYEAPVLPVHQSNLSDDDRNGKPGGSRRQPPSPELVQARKDYKAATGRNWFSGWGVDELRARIEKANG